MNMRYLGVLAAVALLLVASGAAQATGTVTLKNHVDGRLTDGLITVYGDGFPNGASGYGGIYEWTTTTPWSGEGPLVPNWGFCIELPQSPVTGLYNVLMPAEAPLPSQYGTPMGDQKAKYLQELWGERFDPTWLKGLNLAKAEAFSAAVWEIVYEPYTTNPLTYDVTSAQNGKVDNKFFYATNVDTATANTWLRSLDGTGPMADLRALSNTSGQDFLVVVPEPVTMAGVMLGIGSVLTYVRKRRMA